VPSISERLRNEVRDAYFDFDQYVLRKDAVQTLTSDAAALKRIFDDFSNTTVVIEGHCDERGSAEYNLGLGDRRAGSAKLFLMELGISGERLVAISYGKERPQCTEADEACWQKNRRVHFAPGETQTKTVSQLEDRRNGRNSSIFVDAERRMSNQ
jgi:peptidoglycan-associated lipoprotein